MVGIAIVRKSARQCGDKDIQLLPRPHSVGIKEIYCSKVCSIVYQSFKKMYKCSDTYRSRSENMLLGGV